MKKIHRFIAIVGSVAALAACATPTYNYVPTTESFSRPDLGAITTVSVGDDMLSQGTLTYQKGIRVPPATKISGYTMHGGFYSQTGETKKSTFHSFITGTAAPNGFGAMTKGILVDPPQSIEAYKDGGRLCVVTVYNLHTCREREFQRAEEALVGDNSFQQTLIYSGGIDNKINISYREFSGSIARPAYSNEVEYDLSASSEIAYKGARIEVLEATNSSITYRVLQNFR